MASCKSKWKTKYVLWNAVLILNGYGHAYIVFPFKEEYMKKFRELEQYAQEHELRMWKSQKRQKNQKHTTCGLFIFSAEARMSILSSKTLDARR